MPNPTQAHVVCPFCGETAEVAQESGRKGKYYLRCVDDTGRHRCGTIQPRGPTGQQWILNHWQPLNPTESETEAAAAAATAEQSQRRAAKRGRRALPEGDPDE